MACFTNESVFLNVASVGDVCNGRGSCVSGRCVCDDGWTGRGDFFTLDGQACHYPVLLDQILYGITCACFVMLFFFGLQIFIGQKQRRARLSREKSRISRRVIPIYRDTGVVVGFLYTFVACPIFITLAILRVVTDRNAGVDPLVSALFCMGTMLASIIIALSDTALFAMLIKTTFADSSVVTKGLLQYHRNMVYGCTLFFCLYEPISVIICIYMPLGLSTERIVISAVRNVALSIYIGWLVLAAYLSKKQMLKLIAFHENSNDAFSSGQQAKVTRTLRILDRSISESFVLGAYGMTVALLFTIVPQLYCLQAVFYGTVFIGLAGPSNPLHRYRIDRPHHTNMTLAVATNSSDTTPKDLDKALRPISTE